jgi:hypothetical protein
MCCVRQLHFCIFRVTFRRHFSSCCCNLQIIILFIYIWLEATNYSIPKSFWLYCLRDCFVLSTMFSPNQLFERNSEQLYFQLKGEKRFEILTAAVMKSTIFWNITPCSPLSVNRRFGGTSRLHLQGWKNKFSMKPAIYCSGTSVDTQRTTRRYIPEDYTLQI